MSASPIHSRILRSAGELQEILADWRTLWRRSPAATTFQCPEWLLCWIEAFRPKTIAALEFRRADLLVGVAPLLIYEKGAEKVLAFIGGAVSDYLDILSGASDEVAVAECFLQTISAIEGWATLELTDLPAWSSLLRIPGLSPHLSPHDSCSVLPLPTTTTGELLRIFSDRQRANFRNARSRLRKAGGGQIELATADTLSEFVGDLIHLHTSRWVRTGSPGVLHDETVCNFHRAVARRLLDGNTLRLYRLRLHQQTLAVIEAFFEHGRALCYLQGFDPSYAYFSPGTQLMGAVIEDAIRAGMRKFDFLRGTEAYKQHWRAHPEPTFRISLSRAQLASIRSQLAA